VQVAKKLQKHHTLRGQNEIREKGGGRNKIVTHKSATKARRKGKAMAGPTINVPKSLGDL
jgi:hypothetical protein